MEKINKQKVLVAPLDWGLGHATRCVPLIRSLLELKMQVILAAEGSAADLLRQEFPFIQIIPLKGYRISYGQSTKGLAWRIIWQIPKMLKAIYQEHAWLDKLIEREKIDLVISDNRYGLFSKKVPAVFITHQLLIKAPIRSLEWLLQKMNYGWINRFTACWVPDSKDENNLAAALSHPKNWPKIPVHYLGILSRMQQIKDAELKFDFCFLLSGPEPQRTMLENKLLVLLPKLAGKKVLVRGLPHSETPLSLSDDTLQFQHLPSNDLAGLISETKCIVCRSGYSSLMDLVTMQKSAILIPTPGQTEQEYLAKKLAADARFCMIEQDALDLENLLKASRIADFKEFSIPLFTTNKLEALLLAL